MTFYKSIEKTFAGYSTDTYIKNLKGYINDRIKNYAREAASKEAFIEELYEAFYMDFEIDYDSESIEPWKDTEGECYDCFGDIQKFIIYNFSITYLYKGNIELLRYRPSQDPWSSSGLHSKVDYNNDYLRIYFDVRGELDEAEFLRKKKNTIEGTLRNVTYVLADFKYYNEHLREYITEQVNNFLHEQNKTASLLQKLGVKTKESHKDNIQKVEPIKKKETISIPTREEANLNKGMASATYIQVLESISGYFSHMEHLAAHRNHGEEELRDIVLSHLQTTYKSCTVTAETFNKTGKTDICLKSTDGHNFFIAECKIWHGPETISKTIDQLLNRYTTIYDTRLAVIIFNKNASHTDIIEKAVNEVKQHNLFRRTTGRKTDHSQAFVFKHPTDDIDINLELMLFHFPK